VQAVPAKGRIPARGPLEWFVAFPDDRIRLERQGGTVFIDRPAALIPPPATGGHGRNRGLVAGATAAGNSHGQTVALQVSGTGRNVHTDVAGGVGEGTTTKRSTVRELAPFVAD